MPDGRTQQAAGPPRHLVARWEGACAAVGVGCWSPATPADSSAESRPDGPREGPRGPREPPAGKALLPCRPPAEGSNPIEGESSERATRRQDPCPWRAPTRGRNPIPDESSERAIPCHTGPPSGTRPSDLRLRDTKAPQNKAPHNKAAAATGWPPAGRAVRPVPWMFHVKRVSYHSVVSRRSRGRAAWTPAAPSKGRPVPAPRRVSPGDVSRETWPGSGVWGLGSGVWVSFDGVTSAVAVSGCLEPELRASPRWRPAPWATPWPPTPVA